jgi:hypothetical protein
MPRRLPRQPRRAVAGRAVSAIQPPIRDCDQRQPRSRAHRQLVSRAAAAHRPPRQAIPRRRRAAEASSARLLLGSRHLRRGPQDVGDGVRRRGQVHEAIQSWPPALEADPPLDSRAIKRRLRCSLQSAREVAIALLVVGQHPHRRDITRGIVEEVFIRQLSAASGARRASARA